jgi:hypothetical protein
LDMGGPGHHVLQILTHATISYGAFWKVQFTKTVHIQWRKWTVKFWPQWSVSVKKLYLQLCEISDVSCRWSCVYVCMCVCMYVYMYVCMSLVHILKMCLHGCQSPKTTELRDTKIQCLLCS